MKTIIKEQYVPKCECLVYSDCGKLCVHRDMKHAGSLESTQEARIALGTQFNSIQFNLFAINKKKKKKYNINTL